MVQDNLERLLRHVEVKRKEALIARQDTPDSDTLWLERHAVALLFCHQAIRSHDLRFLNAALKLNDWAFPYYQRPVSELRLAGYVQALTAQEQATQELSSMIRIVVMAPIHTSIYSRLVVHLAAQEADMEVAGVLTRTPWSLPRIRSEFRRDAPGWPRKWSASGCWPTNFLPRKMKPNHWQR